MAAIRRTGTKPELALRSALHRAGKRFRKDLRLVADGVPTRPDVVFTRSRVAVFVDGCFWHGCPVHGRAPTANTHYWGPKLLRNAERDRLQTAALQRAGWTVVRLWEHVTVDQMAEEVLAALDGPRG
jgi:DNA mismatch endonuclease (patch repair protein)